MSNVVEFPKAKARRITKGELQCLRLSAEINAMRDEATKFDRDLVDALVELEDRREEETW